MRFIKEEPVPASPFKIHGSRDDIPDEIQARPAAHKRDQGFSPEG
jgi:hypothetical protein